MITDAMFVTAEDSQNPKPGVWVMLTTWSLKLLNGTLPAVFVVTTSTGYRAELEACLRDDCFTNKAPLRCVKDNCPESSRHHCHRTHIEHASVFAAKVGKTYGSAVRKDAPSGLLAHPKKVRNVSIKAWADDLYAQALEGR
jgi:hypothetical protein